MKNDLKFPQVEAVSTALSLSALLTKAYHLGKKNKVDKEDMCWAIWSGVFNCHHKQLHKVGVISQEASTCLLGIWIHYSRLLEYNKSKKFVSTKKRKVELRVVNYHKKCLIKEASLA